MGVPVEKLTPERRRERTREVLLDAAAEVFAARGYEGASLEEIAETAGFTRGAIYKHFGNKEELFFAVTDRLNERVIETFRAVAPDHDSRSWDVARLAELWQASVDGDVDLLAIGTEFNLYVLRNPVARDRAVAHRRHQADLVAAFIEDVATASGMSLRLPAHTLAQVILAAADGLTFASRIDGVELFGPFLEVLNNGMTAD